MIRVAFRAPFMMIFAMIMSFSVNAQLSWVFVAFIPFIALALGIVIKFAHPIFGRVFKTYDKLNNIVQENLHGIRVVKSFVREEHEVEKFGKISDLIYKDFSKAEKIVAFNMPVMQLSVYLCILIISWIASHQIVGGTMTTGELISMMTYVFQILMSLMFISITMVMITMSKASGDRIAEVLTEEIDLKNDAEPLTLVKDGRKHSSRQEGFYYRPRETENTNTPIRHAAILTDRSAFNPGETVQFKVILYEGTYEYATRPEAIRLHATLTDPSGKVIGESNLVTGEFGSAAGSFVLKKGERGGMYTIDVSEGGKQIASTRVRADEFVLPTFTLNWEPDRRSYLPQDNVTVRGNVKSYSGHSLGTATARYTVESNGATLAEGPLALDASGDFDIRFTAPEGNDRVYYGYYGLNVSVRVTVTDSTGETLSFNKSILIRSRLSLSVDVRNRCAGRVQMASRRSSGILVGDDFIRACFISCGAEETHPTLKISYKVLRGATTLLSGEAPDGRPVDLSLAGLPSGLYTVEATATARSDAGKEYTQTTSCEIIKCADSDTALDADVRCFFKELPDDGQGIALQIGATTGPVWAVVELYGDGNRLLEKRMVRLAGIRGKAGSLETVRFARKSSYPEALTINVFWFRDEDSCKYSVSSYKAADPFQLPLAFSRFLDTTLPHTDYQFTIRTGAGTEVAATIFDKSTETLQPNVWHSYFPGRRTLPQVHYDQITGTDSASDYGVRYLARGTKAMSANAILGYSAPAEDLVLAESASLDASYEEVEEDSVAFMKESGHMAGTPAVRSDFANTIAWEPFLRADDNGEVTFRFTTADKLSTYYVQLFAHDKAFHNATLRREMVVTLPVKVAVVQPQYLYEGDRYVARVTVANSLDKPVSGRINVCFLDGKDHKTAPLISEEEQAVTVPAGGSADFSCAISAPAVADLGLLVSFVADEADYGSDAVFVTLPVKPAVQTITEAHSALMLSWMDREAILTALRGQFVNVPGSAASLREISILDMIREAIPEKVLPTSDNLLAQSEALFANCLLDRLPDAKGSAATAEQRAEMCAKILACRNEDGGFGWFAEMRSSPLLTSVLLERLAAMGDACPQQLRDAIPAAVKYLDATYFGDAARPLWCGGLSLDQYLHTRSLFPEVAFAPKAGAKVMREFKKAAKAYLVPGSKRGLNGQVFAKARRMKTLRALLQSEAGAALARNWGVSLFAKRRLARSLDKDVASLLQYAVPHQSGGTYYPNAVMPWRGLLESELYAHTLICNLLTDCGHSEVAEGIRLWTMVQKETQQWADDPAYIEAIDCVLRALDPADPGPRAERHHDPAAAPGQGRRQRIHRLAHLHPRRQAAAGRRRAARRRPDPGHLPDLERGEPQLRAAQRAAPGGLPPGRAALRPPRLVRPPDLDHRLGGLQPAGLPQRAGRPHRVLVRQLSGGKYHPR